MKKSATFFAKSGKFPNFYKTVTLRIFLKNQIDNFVDLKQYKGYHTIFQSYKSFHIYGFNSLKSSDNWDGKLVTNSFKGDNKSWIICFKGEPIVNGVTMKTMDYAKLSDKNYDVVLNNGIIGVFTKHRMI